MAPSATLISCLWTNSDTNSTKPKVWTRPLNWMSFLSLSWLLYHSFSLNALYSWNYGRKKNQRVVLYLNSLNRHVVCSIILVIWSSCNSCYFPLKWVSDHIKGFFFKDVYIACFCALLLCVLFNSSPDALTSHWNLELTRKCKQPDTFPLKHV